MKKIIIPIIILIVLILWPIFFLKNGTYFFLDAIFYPVYHLNNFFSQSFYWHIRDLLTLILWYEFYSKVFMIVVLLIWAFLWIKVWELVLYLTNNKNEKIDFLVKIFWIIFILFNPFVYERLVTQIGIALWTFFIWLWLIYLIFYILKQKNKNFYFSALFFGISFNIYPHAIVFISIIWIISLLFFLRKFKLKSLFIGFFIFIWLNINWLLWLFFFWSNHTLSKVHSFNEVNMEVFKSNSLSNLWVEITQLLWYGFWWERYHHLYTPDIVNKRWYVAWFIIFIMVIIGFFMLYKKHRKISLYLLFLAIISYILSLGISSHIFYLVNNLLYKYVPFYIGMREPEKILWLTMIIYAIFFLITLIEIFKLFSNYIKKSHLNKKIFNTYIFVWFIFLLIWAWSPNMLLWFNWQLKIINYPNDYYNIKKYLNKKEKILILPWHSYVSCSWTYGKIISNPAKAFFNDYSVISADNIEIWNLYTNSKNILLRQIENFLHTKNYNILKRNNITTILFMRNCADFKNYSFLEKSDYLSKVFSWNYLDLYNIK